MKEVLPIETFVNFFTLHLSQLRNTYYWPVGEKTKRGLPDFPWHETAGGLEECVALKYHLTEKWNRATVDS